MINLGSLDRTGLLYSRTPVTSASGAVAYTQTLLGRLFVSLETPRTTTILTAARDAEKTETVFLSRWFEGLANGMVLEVEGVSYRIVRRDELGRRDGWRIYGRAVN